MIDYALILVLGVISLVINIVLIYNFIVMCKSVRRIADKLAPEEDNNANNSGELSTTSLFVVFGLVLILIVIAGFFIATKLLGF
jgi:hypothetical protein